MELKTMTLNEAIEHLKELLSVHDFPCEECRQEHEQLLAWLVELKTRRADNG